MLFYGDHITHATASLTEIYIYVYLYVCWDGLIWYTIFSKTYIRKDIHYINSHLGTTFVTCNIYSTKWLKFQIADLLLSFFLVHWMFYIACLCSCSLWLAPSSVTFKTIFIVEKTHLKLKHFVKVSFFLVSKWLQIPSLQKIIYMLRKIRLSYKEKDR